MTESGTTEQRRWPLEMNMPLWERVVRVSAGLLLAATVLSGAGLLASLGSPARHILAVVLAVGAVDLVLSGAIGWCPIYRYVRMPWTPRSRR